MFKSEDGREGSKISLEIDLPYLPPLGMCFCLPKIIWQNWGLFKELYVIGYNGICSDHGLQPRTEVLLWTDKDPNANKNTSANGMTIRVEKPWKIY
ncbi:MAG TPA: hypothetical protein VLG69_02745 [Candidatus Andersenbacteria bacterium]|nr:hypothetical protein [Candidatus Andersenbacteria bacterium]